MCMETSYDILLENTTKDCVEELTLVVNVVLKRHTNIKTEIGLEEWVGLEVNAEKTIYMVMYCDQNLGQNHNTKDR